MIVWELIQKLTKCDPGATVLVGLNGRPMKEDKTATRVTSLQRTVRRRVRQYVHIDDGESPK